MRTDVWLDTTTFADAYSDYLRERLFPYEDFTTHQEGVINVNVSDVKTIYAEGHPIGVKVYFADGTEEKAICEEGDRPSFNLDFGITICLCKKLMGGSHNYNRVIQKIRKDMEAKAYAEALKKEQERQANEAKQKARQEEARKKRETREREIELQKEAFLRAMKEFFAANGSEEKNKTAEDFEKQMAAVQEALEKLSTDWK